MSLPNKVSPVPLVHNCPSAPRVSQRPSTLRVPKCLMCSSAWVPWVPRWCPLSVVRVLKCTHIKLIVFCLLRNKMRKFYHVLLARYNHSKEFQKRFWNILLNFRKLNMMDARNLFLVKVQCFSCSLQLHYCSKECSFRINESLLIF